MGRTKLFFFLLSPGFPWDLAPTKSLSLLSIEIAEIPSGKTPLCYISCLILVFDAIRFLCCFFFLSTIGISSKDNPLVPFFLNTNLFFFSWTVAVIHWSFTHAAVNLIQKKINQAARRRNQLICSHQKSKLTLYFTRFTFQTEARTWRIKIYRKEKSNAERWIPLPWAKQAEPEQ